MTGPDPYQLRRAISEMLSRYGQAEFYAGAAPLTAASAPEYQHWSRASTRRMRAVHRLVDALERLAVKTGAVTP